MYFVGHIVVLHLSFLPPWEPDISQGSYFSTKMPQGNYSPENQLHDPDSVRTEILSIFRDYHVSIPCTSPMHW